MIDIEPCPWCFGGDLVAATLLSNWWVACKTCVASGMCCGTQAEAITAWNRVAGQRWRPIETAEHGREYLLYSPAIGVSPEEMEVHAASWGWRTDSVSNMSYHSRATHWRPLPEPPDGQT